MSELSYRGEQQTGPPGVQASSEAATSHNHESGLMGIEPDDDICARALAEITREYPAWHAWPGTIAGVLYARRPRTSPPLVVRATTPDQLRRAIENAERKRGLR